MSVIATTNGDQALSIFVAVVIGASFVILAIVCWIFWRAAQRDAQRDAAERDALASQRALAAGVAEPSLEPLDSAPPP